MNKYIKLEEALSNIKMLALDVDGVLTDCSIIYDLNGEALKAFNAKDGLGINLIQKQGIIVAIITGRKSDIVTKRMQDLHVKYVYQGIDDKLSVVEGLLNQFMIDWDNLAYVGDDLPDLPVLKKAAFSACPPDAVAEVLSQCFYVTKKEAGKGCVREVIDLILKYSVK